MSRFVVCVFIIVVGIVGIAQAQDDPPDAPDYRVQALGTSISEDGESIVVEFGVSNIGADAQARVSVQLIDLSTGEVVTTAISAVRPLQGGGDTETLSIEFPVDTFPPQSNQALQIAVGIDEIEAADSVTIGNNYAGISVEVPFYEAETPTTPASTNSTNGTPDATIITIPLIDVEIDTSDRSDVLTALGIVVSGVVILWLLFRILGTLFRRTPKFGNWQPPYAMIPHIDPNSTLGRRQAWQQHAQNNIVPVPCNMGTVYARKVLLGTDGQYLSGWRIKALRMTQYDMYGRVSRSEILATRAMVQRLDRVARRNHRLDARRVGRRVRPVARGLARQFRKKINKRSALLPIALDVSLQGRHGEIRILFELYDCQRGQPNLIDYWEPEMHIRGRAIHESYTYSIFGQSGGETVRAFKKRIGDDIERLLVVMLWIPPAPPEQAPAAPTRTTPEVPDEIPAADTMKSAPVVPPMAYDTPNAETDDEEPSAQETQISGGSI